jgi:hypothetical protein
MKSGLSEPFGKSSGTGEKIEADGSVSRLSTKWGLGIVPASIFLHAAHRHIQRQLQTLTLFLNEPIDRVADQPRHRHLLPLGHESEQTALLGRQRGSRSRLLRPNCFVHRNASHCSAMMHILRGESKQFMNTAQFWKLARGNRVKSSQQPLEQIVNKLQIVN